MAIFPVATAARMLGIHPKTLHHWLGQTNVPLVAHPTDARIKCVAQEHLWEVASRHGRPLAGLPSAPASRKEQAKPLFAHHTTVALFKLNQNGLFSVGKQLHELLSHM